MARQTRVGPQLGPFLRPWKNRSVVDTERRRLVLRMMPLPTIEPTMRERGTDRVRVGTSLPRRVNRTRVVLKISLAESFALFPTNLLHSQPNPHEPSMHDRWPIVVSGRASDVGVILVSLKSPMYRSLIMLGSLDAGLVCSSVHRDQNVHFAQSSALPFTFCRRKRVTGVST